MIKKLIPITIATASMASIANAALVNIASNTSASPVRLVTSAFGIGGPAIGSIVRIGTYTVVPNFAAVTTPADLFANFVPIGESSADANDGTNGPLTIATTGVAGSGWSGTINSVQNTDSRFTATTRLYIMVLNTTVGALDAATEAIIMTDAGWTIPATATRVMTSAQITAQSEVLFGTYAPGGNAAQLQMSLINPIPEPTTAMMGALVGLGLIARRRR